MQLSHSGLRNGQAKWCASRDRATRKENVIVMDGKQLGADKRWPLALAACIGLLFALGYGMVAVYVLVGGLLSGLAFFILACIASGFAQSGKGNLPMVGIGSLSSRGRKSF